MSLLRSTLHASAIAGALVLATSATAAAGGKLPLASEASPPRFVDVTSLAIDAAASGEAYRPRITTAIHGVTSDADAVRFDWIHKGKVIASKRCNLTLDRAIEGRGSVTCTYDGKPLTVAGDLTAQLIYIDDQAEQEYLLREFKLTVGTFTFVGKKNFQVLQDDNLGQAYVYQHKVGDRYRDYYLTWSFWAATSKTFSGKLRCTAGGTKLKDIDVGTDSGKVVVEALDNASGEDHRYKWTQMVMTSSDLLFGIRDEVIASWRSQGDFSQRTFLGDHPGDWSCDLRKDGAVIRTFRFHVNEQGVIDQHAAGGQAGMPLLREGVAMVDVRLPAQNSYDLRVRKAAIKKSMAYGMPWPKHPSIDAMLEAAPGDSGFPDPGQAGKGKTAKKAKKGKK